MFVKLVFLGKGEMFPILPTHLSLFSIFTGGLSGGGVTVGEILLSGL
jgi:hypothetical protein